MRAHREGRDVLLAFKDDIWIALKTAYKSDFDSDALMLKQSGTIVRREIFNRKCAFEGHFSEMCHQDAVPPPFLALLSMVIGGANIQEQSNNPAEQQVSLSIAQLNLVQFNAVHRRREQARMYHLPVYLGLLLHGETRKKGLVNKLYDLGLSISCDRVTEMGNEVCARYHAENVVCPPKLRKGASISILVYHTGL